MNEGDHTAQQCGKALVQGPKEQDTPLIFTPDATRTPRGQQREARLNSEPAAEIGWPYFQGFSPNMETN